MQHLARIIAILRPDPQPVPPENGLNAYKLHRQRNSEEVKHMHQQHSDRHVHQKPQAHRQQPRK